MTIVEAVQSYRDGEITVWELLDILGIPVELPKEDTNGTDTP